MKAEQRTAETLLEQKQSIEINGKVYEVAPPTIATLALVSAEISKLPTINEVKGEEMFFEALKYGKNSLILAEIASILIIGAKKYRKHRRTKIFGKILGIKNRYERLREDIMQSSPKKVDEIIGTCLNGMQIHDFFLLTTFLAKVNLTKQTK